MRKSIKKLAAVLDIPQGEVIRRAIKLLEKSLIAGNKDSTMGETERERNLVQEIWEAASEGVFASDLESKRIQQLLMRGAETIDDFILNDWDTGLEG